QTLCATTNSLNVSALVIRLKPTNPNCSSTCATSPPPPNTCCHTEMTITQDRKCGRYTTVWMVRLIREDSSESSSRARAIGAGNANTSCSTAITRVFRSAISTSGSEKIATKLSSPTQAEPENPRNGEKSWKATMLPSNGT